MIGIQTHSVSTVAVEPTELMVLSRDDLMSIFESDKELFGILMMNIAREASRRLHQTDELLLHYLHSDMHQAALADPKLDPLALT